MSKKILIIYATAGIGHKKAAVAVKKALDEIAPKETEVTIIDALDYTNAFFKWSYLQFYLLMVNRLPTIWGLCYYLTDNFFINLIVSKVRRISNWFNSRRLERYILANRPDVIISTHFFASEVVSDMKRRGVLGSSLITVVTDYRLHLWWIVDHTDIYVVGGEDAREDLLRSKVDPDRIKVWGIPAEPVFLKEPDRIKLYEETGLKEGIFTILVIGGGFGVGPIEGIIKVIKELTVPLQVAVVCGHNDDLAKKIVNLKEGARAHIKVLGFIDNVYEYMDLSDIIISKAGGITVTESLAKDLPMIVISPIIGQETRNSDYIVARHAAFRIDRLGDLRPLLEKLVLHPAELEKTQAAIQEIKKPYACYKIAKLALGADE